MHNETRHPLLGGAAAALLAGALMYGGCKNFLDNAAAPQGTLNELTLLTKAGVEASLIAAYRALDWNNGVGGGWGNAASNWVWGSVPSDDAYKGSEASDQPPINDIEAYHWSTADAEGYLNDKWRGAYEGVVRSNATLRLLNTVRTSKPGAIEDPDAKAIAGEAIFLRAHYHFEAWRMWGNIPYYREDDPDFRKANITSAEAVAEILKDLDSAVKLLSPDKRNGQVGRVDQWVAKAYKGRVQAYAGQWDNALTTLREVQASGHYDLQPSFDQVWTGFQAFANGKETILAYQAAVNDGAQDGNDANYGERLNFPHSGSHFGCCGFHQPAQNLLNFYAVDGSGLPLALTDATWNARNAVFNSDVKVPVDPRMDWTVGRDGVPFKDWGLHEPGWIRAPAYGGPYSAKKNIHENASGSESTVGWTASQLNGVNIHIFRYADMLLMLAEAEVEAAAGSLANARTIVNQVRQRAAVKVQGCGLPVGDPGKRDSIELVSYPTCAGDTRIAVPLGDPSVKWAIYQVGQYPASAFATKELARTAVRYERRLELAMEGQRFFDLRRWNIAEQTLNPYVAVEKNRRLYLLGAEAYSARHNLFPIPAIQIELSKVAGVAQLKQNTGW
ncbi:MAG TPA: RagB/SusD family nutrient uptake outer membrane protein [Gemmatimonadaceae bacterium]|nr:RagB/SusD family nutrient uptake outer membrane protein [Gemmatimonadaceae bacterium]